MDGLTIRAADKVSGFKYYYFEPSLPAAILFVILFGLATIAHSFQMLRSRTWFMIPFVIGGICEYILTDLNLR